MIDFKFYKELKLLAENMGLPGDKETLKKYVKLVEKFNQDQIKEVQRLKLKNLEGRLQIGQKAVNKKALEGHILACNSVHKEIDKIMRNPSTYERGRDIAKQINILSMSIASFEMFAVGKQLPFEEKPIIF